MVERRNNKDRRQSDRRIESSPRSSHIDSHSNSYTIYSIDDRKKRILLNGIAVKLSPKEYDLLRYLIRNRSAVISTEQILANIWPPTSRVDPDEIKQYIYILRQKIEADPKNPKRLTTLNGFGYCLE